MKYKNIIIIEDPDILKFGNDYELARLVGCSPSYINLLRYGKRVANEKFYLKLKEAIENKVLTSQ